MNLYIPMQLPSAANLREHWAAKAKRTKAQRDAVLLALKASHTQELAKFARDAQRAEGCRLVVTLTRCWPRKLDSDNLASAFKAVRDAVAEFLAIDDGNDEAVRWVYAQWAPVGSRRGITIGIGAEWISTLERIPHVNRVAGATMSQKSTVANRKAPPSDKQAPTHAEVAERVCSLNCGELGIWPDGRCSNHTDFPKPKVWR